MLGPESRRQASGSGAEEGELILIVEDDPSITMGLEMNLVAEGYRVMVAHDGEEGLAKARQSDIDLIVLDVMLPKLNGFELLRTLRTEGNTTPILMLSARGAEVDKVMGLELGAEDYVTKPFGLAELLARIRRLLRSEARGRHSRSSTVRAGDLEINPATREVLREGTLIELTATEFDVLLCLVEARGSVLSREQIQKHVWGPGHHGTPRTVDNFLLQLRSKLEVDSASPRHLLTVRGVGYRFVA